jgi:hypothetical protein
MTKLRASGAIPAPFFVGLASGFGGEVDSVSGSTSIRPVREELISEVTIDGAGRMLLRPADTLFDDLHMAGAWSFRWDQPTQSLAIPQPREWTYRDWFDHVVDIIGSQYGVHLKIGPQTRWTSVPPSVRDEIEGTPCQSNNS